MGAAGRICCDEWARRLAEALGRLKQGGVDAALVQRAGSVWRGREGCPRIAAVVADVLAAYETAVQERLRQAELERVAAERDAEEQRAVVEQERTREAPARGRRSGEPSGGCSV